MQYDGDNDAFAGMYARLRGQLQAGLNESALRHFGYGLEDLKHMLMIGKSPTHPSPSIHHPSKYRSLRQLAQTMSTLANLVIN